ncbi:DNA polymerase-3 subunit epsilon [Catalinimonas alkaloidigena]|uniref:DNA polymerase-3 subunit epsilon n=1 Tax=Catalinimonas alkaloidigena TaxID=1075417 RepID=A0A1G9IW65_9BACT|nr:3'-5' exonuclease [Catalinimonas alkaloidigena]SDL29430.1 DNA polymerase-3 subunit epsilon [Catalinimonas alkaloidigena]
MIPEYLLFVDTETSGRPKHWDSRRVEEWPYIVQVAWVIFTRDGKEVKARNYLIKPDDYDIERKSERIHGISVAVAQEKGIARRKALRALYSDLRQYKPMMVAHYMDFDQRMLEMGFRRAGLKNIIKETPRFCTMKATSEYIHVPGRHYPKLGELYQTLFKRRLEHQHDAMCDARAVADCFFELVRKGDIDEHVIEAQQSRSRITKKIKKRTGYGLLMLLTVILTALLILFLVLQ